MKRISAIASCIILGWTISPVMPVAAAPADQGGVRAALVAETVPEVLAELFPGMRPEPHRGVRLEAPLIVARDGTVLIKVSAKIDQIEAIAIVTNNNRQPLNAVIKLRKADPYFATRIKLEQTSQLTAYVATANGLFSASSLVKLSSAAYGIDQKAQVQQAVTTPLLSDEVTKLRIRRRGDRSKVQVLIRHPMKRAVADPKNNSASTGDHYVETMTFELNGELVARAMLGPNIAENPLITIAATNTKQGDNLVVGWSDNQGHQGQAAQSID